MHVKRNLPFESRHEKGCIQIFGKNYRRVPVRVSHVAIGESSKELAKPNL